MNYTIRWDEQSLEDLEALDYKTAEKIVLKVESYLIHNPKGLGKPLSHEYSGLYRYRFGDYRVIYEIKSEEVIIVKVGHRKDVYE
jgi:mRNA interferase RelE/StbE